MRPLLIALVLATSSTALAQGTAPPTPDTAPPPQSPAPQAEMSEMKSQVKSMYEEFRSFKERLPFSLGAGVYLFYYQPLDYTTFSPTDRNGYFQVYAFYLKLDKEVLLRPAPSVATPSSACATAGISAPARPINICAGSSRRTSGFRSCTPIIDPGRS